MKKYSPNESELIAINYEIELERLRQDRDMWMKLAKENADRVNELRAALKYYHQMSGPNGRASKALEKDNEYEIR